MPQLSQLTIGQTGYVHLSQLYVERQVGGPINLFVEPRFATTPTREMLRLTAKEDISNPGRSRYGIYLPGTEKYKGLQRPITWADAQRRGLIKVRTVYVLSDEAGKTPFATIPTFFFNK